MEWRKKAEYIFQNILDISEILDGTYTVYLVHALYLEVFMHGYLLLLFIDQLQHQAHLQASRINLYFTAFL